MGSNIWDQLRSSGDPAIRRLAGDESADVLASPRVQILLEFPSAHPYRKWWGTHWRLVALADLGVPPGTTGLDAGVEHELSWLTSTAHRRAVRWVDGLARQCASMEGNAVYSCSMLGYATDPRVRTLVDSLLEWQWPDGGWNCDIGANGRRSSFHETVTPALGLVAYHDVTGDVDAWSAAMRSAELFLEHHLFRSLRDHEVIHPAWTKLHYPPYWHYDVLQGLRCRGLGQGRTERHAQPEGCWRASSRRPRRVSSRDRPHYDARNRRAGIPVPGARGHLAKGVCRWWLATSRSGTS